MNWAIPFQRMVVGTIGDAREVLFWLVCRRKDFQVKRSNHPAHLGPSASSN